MSFKDFNNAVQQQFESMCDDDLFIVNIDRDAIWETYLKAFPPGTDPIFRERSHHNCSCCKSFIRQAGNIIKINDDYTISTIWDNFNVPAPYDTVTKAMSKYIRSILFINGRFLTDQKKIGVSKNLDNIDPEIVWNHFNLGIPEKYIMKKSRIGTVQSKAFNAQNVFGRALDEITDEALEIVSDLIAQNSLYRGDQYKHMIDKFIEHKKEYNKFQKFQNFQSAINQDLYIWKHAHKDTSISHIRNSAIGTLLVDLSDNMDLEKAVRRYESVTAPSNYKRPTALITPKMVENAKKEIEELGLSDALHRRFAKYTDLKPENMIFVNRDTGKSDDLFTELANESAKRPKQKLDGIEEISIDDFVTNVLPKINSMELLVENRHEKNLMSLIAPDDINVNEQLFKWPNNFSWAYNGDVTDSIRERVKAAGGNVTGFMRASLAWFNYDDLDLHCKEPNEIIYYHHKRSKSTNGQLDVDMNAGGGQTREAVENIVWPHKTKLINGKYEILVHNYSKRESTDVGFELEFELDGKITKFAYDKAVPNNKKIPVLTVTVKNGKFDFEPHLPSTTTSKNIWGINTERFQSVSLMLPSPNYWNGSPVGQKHWFFILKDCKNPEAPRGFYNEFLKGDFDKHRKVFEILGNKLRVEKSEDQLSGVGFSSTVRNSVICRVSGSFTRTLKINF